MDTIHPIRRTAWLHLAVLLGLLALAFPAHGQLPPGPQPPPCSTRTEPTQQAPVPSAPASGSPQSVIAVETTLVNLDVLVTDEDGGLGSQRVRDSDGTY